MLSGQELLGGLGVLRAWVRGVLIRAAFFYEKLFSQSEFVAFQCLICAKHVSAPLRLVNEREGRSCYGCGSTLRFRSIIACLSEELYGQVIPLKEFPHNKSLTGMGMSDANLYARLLRKKIAYTNTFYHAEPRLDIKSPSEFFLGQYDFVISSDVFEHVPPPMDDAFKNLGRLLKPGGVVIFSVPYVNEGDTTEHFPELFEFQLIKREGERVLVNQTQDGRTQEFRNLCFHGGWGATLEMRVFSKSGLLEAFKRAGYIERFYDPHLPQFGIYRQKGADSLVISLRMP